MDRMSSHLQTVMSPLLQPHADFNVTQLGLISLQSRVPEGFSKGWSFPLGESSEGEGNVRCWTREDCVVPHSMANEIFMGIVLSLIIEGIEFDEKKYVLRGASIPQLLSRAGYKHKMTGRLYREAHQALKDLSVARYEAEGCWRDDIQHKSVQRKAIFGLISTLDEMKEKHDFNPDQNKHLFDIYVDTLVANSINGPLTLALNPNIIDNLISPQARGLYRIVESIRRDSQDPSKASDELSIRVTDLQYMMRVLSTRPSASALLRNLQGPLEQMQAAGYLKSYNDTGRGDAAMLHLTFEESHSLFDTRVLKRLNALGIIGANAQSLATTTTLAEIDKAEEITDREIRNRQSGNNPIKSPVGFLVSLLQGGGARDELRREREGEKRKKKTVRKPEIGKTVAQAAPEPEPQGEEATQRALKNLQLALGLRKVKVSEQDLSTLECLIKEGKLAYSVTLRWLSLSKGEIEADIQAQLNAQ